MHTQILILGGGPAGLSAWLTCRARGLSARLITNPPSESPLAKAPRIDNYAGFHGIGGRELLERFYAAAEAQGLAPVYGRAGALMNLGDRFMASVGSEVYSAEALILAVGIPPAVSFAGEERLLGKGLSYCATCDGMLYRGRRVAVIGLAPDAAAEAEFLRSVGCEVEYFDKSRASRYEILGEDRVSALRADGVDYPVDGVFLLRSAIRPDKLLDGLALDGAHIRTDERMATNLAGVFAAGDCIGRPYQIARAVGQGNTAALSASEYVTRERK